MKRRVVVFGLGSFGQYLAHALYQEGCEVLGIDRDPNVVQALKDEMTQTAAVDVRDRDALKTLGVAEMDIAVVGMGDNVASSILLVQHLRKLGVPEIIAKATSEEHADALQSVGATRIVFPERDIAQRLARHITRPNVVDYIPLEEGFSIIELNVPRSFQGQTIGELNVRRRYGLSVLAVQQGAEGAEGKNGKRHVISSPPADFRLEPGQTLLLYGSEKDLERVRKLD